MIRIRTLSLAALAVAGSAAWAWPQGPSGPTPAASSTLRSDVVGVSGDGLTQDVLVTGKGVVISGEFPATRSVAVTGSPAATQDIFEVGQYFAAPPNDPVRAIRFDEAMRVAVPLISGPAILDPRTVFEARVESLSSEEMEQQHEMRRWTEMLHPDRSAEERATARKALSVLLEKQFGRDLERREKEVAQLEERVKGLRTQVEKRKAAMEKIIDLRLDTIQQEAEGLGFPQAASRPAGIRPAPVGKPYTIKLDSPPLLPETPEM